MKNWLVALALGVACAAQAQQKDYAEKVNPFIGTGGHGHTYPGPSMPFGMVQLSPDTRLKGWDGCSGYHYTDSVMYGFSHTHLSGTGIEDYCDVLLMPVTGKPSWNNEEYASPFSHRNEKAYAGFYSVLLDKYNVKASLTATKRVGLHKYEFPASAQEGHVLLDLYHRDIVINSSLKVVNDSTVIGMRRSTSWAKDQILFFAMKFSRPFRSHTVALSDSTKGALPQAEGRNIKAYFTFNTAQPLYVKVAISGVSEAGALKNLDAEMPGFDFDKTLADAKAAWNKELGKIEVKGGTADQQAIFYSALYHACLNPNLYMDVDGQYRGTDLKIHKAEGFDNYSVFSLWDTHRALHPLMTLINQQKTNDWINTFLAQYKYGGMLPVWELSGNETFCMIGYHSVPVIVDAYQKGIRGYDARYALEAMRSYAEGERFGMQHYIRQGYLSMDTQPESVSRTLEYSYDDWCIAQMGKMLGNTEVFNRYMKRAQSYKNLYDASTGFMRGKIGGRWMSPFDPTEVNNFFTEANSWQYSFAVPQDVSGMIRLYGGKEKFTKKLNLLFTTEDKLSGRHQSDITGLIGQYAHGNEPSHHIAYLFNYLGQPWRTQELVHQVMTTLYHNAPDGLSGNEDCGQMSAWYVMSAMGIYPVTPGAGTYALGTPTFDEVKLHFENGKSFTIKASQLSDKNFYVQGVKVNGKALPNSWIAHSTMMQGGSMEFTMGATPNKTWAATDANVPHSSIASNQIVAVPYAEAASDRFTATMKVSLKEVEPNTVIYYTLDGSTPTSRSTKYTQPVTLNKTTTLKAVAFRNGQYSQVMQTPFYLIPTDKTIQVLSKIHPQFEAGGPDGLIDGIRGQDDFRLGAWQSHYPGNLEAIVDLKAPRQLKKLGLSVLQDLGVWIWYPTQVEFFVSDNGKDFSSAGVVKNTFSDREYGSFTQVLSLPVNIRTRYVKVVATTHGIIPDWHPGKGEPCHIFADEIIIE
ncbi:glycoside hydrolase family 92 protein [Chitinophaga lutea]|uniref:Glycoside hydrolase family 92 protein n=1 Tax=Chitinophaga lutea TaxID=2488634 RepID=A0A3N4PWS4_9BACT|nr:GH92 family glycosyl hydrolase [Chitinophaga lutea]RPE12358.1 glycoside hydrolase family 92 protein [Chitinophaga lutea]